MKTLKTNGNRAMQACAVIASVLICFIIAGTVLVFTAASAPAYAEDAENPFSSISEGGIEPGSATQPGGWSIPDPRSMFTLDQETSTDESIEYGCRTISGSTKEGTTVSVIINNKTYSCVAGSEDMITNFSIGIPLVRIGTLTVSFVNGNETCTRNVKVVKDSEIETTGWVLKNSTKVPVLVTNAHKGDIVKVTIGKKVYKKKITKNKAKLKLKFKIKKPGRYKLRMKTVLYNKFGQVLARENEYVYLSNTVHVGDSKKKVRWLASWSKPYRKNKYTNSEQWCYDWDDDPGMDAYLYFDSRGRVTGWQKFGV